MVGPVCLSVSGLAASYSSEAHLFGLDIYIILTAHVGRKNDTSCATRYSVFARFNLISRGGGSRGPRLARIVFQFSRYFLRVPDTVGDGLSRETNRSKQKRR